MLVQTGVDMDIAFIVSNKLIDSVFDGVREIRPLAGASAFI